MGVWDGVAGSVIGGIGGSLLTNAANRGMANDQMRFQERMSSTSHQREVKDLVKAGLNPILSVNNGASTPQGAMSPAENPGAAITSALELKAVNSQIEKNQSEIGLLDSQKNKTDVETEVAKRHIPESDFKNEIYRKVKPMINKTLEAGSAAARDIKNSNLYKSLKVYKD